MELEILPSKPHPEVPRTVRVSHTVSPLVLTFDADRSYLQSPSESMGMKAGSWGEAWPGYSIVLSGILRPEVLRELRDVVSERKEAWEEGSTYPPVSELSLNWACHFMILLPKNTTDSELSADPDGEISLEWRGGVDHILSVGIGADGTIYYAYVSGNDRMHASWNLEKGLPDSLKGMLRSFTSEVEPAYAAR